MQISRNLIRRLEKHSRTILALVLIAVAILVLYWQDLVIVFEEATQNEAVSHLIVVPVIFAYFVYRKKETVKALVFFDQQTEKKDVVMLSEITGISVCLFAFLLYWYGSYSFYALEYHLLSLMAFVAGTVLLLFSVKVFVALLFPILFLAFLIPSPFGITYSTGVALGNFNAQASYTLLRTIGVPVTLSSTYGPPTLFLDKPEAPMEIAVDLPCSGIYSLVAFTLFAASLMYIARGSIVKKSALLLIGFSTLMILNILRISLVVYIAYKFGEAIAMTIFHVVSGWILIFVGMLILLFAAERFLHLEVFGDKSRIAPCQTCDNVQQTGENFCPSCGSLLRNRHVRLSRRFWPKMAALLVASYLVAVTMQAPVFAFSQGLTVNNPNLEATMEVFPELPGYNLQFINRDTDFEKISDQDASLLYAYLPQNASLPVIYMLVSVADSIINLHSWEVCLVTWQTARGYPQLVAVLNSKELWLMENPPIIAKYFVFNHPDDYIQVTLYWYQKGLFKTGLTIEPKYMRISLLALTRNATDTAALEQRLWNAGQVVAAHWEPLKHQTLVSLTIPSMQVLLAATILFAVVLQMSQYTRELKTKSTNLRIFESWASPHEKLLIQAVTKLSQKTRETTTQNIVSSFREAAGKAAKTDTVLSMLNNLERHGILRKRIISINDKPRLIWSS